MKWGDDVPVYASLFDRPDPAPTRFHPLLYAALAVLAVFAGVGVVALAVFVGVIS